MSRIPGRNSMLYMGITSGGTAEPIMYLSEWELSFATDRYDVTAQGDVGKVYVAGLPDGQGTFSGFYDDATPQMYTAASDGIARKMYMYPDKAVNTKYWFGTGMADFSVTFGVDSAASISGSFNAASAFQKVG